MTNEEVKELIEEARYRFDEELADLQSRCTHEWVDPQKVDGVMIEWRCSNCDVHAFALQSVNSQNNPRIVCDTERGRRVLFVSSGVRCSSPFKLKEEYRKLWLSLETPWNIIPWKEEGED